MIQPGVGLIQPASTTEQPFDARESIVLCCVEVPQGKPLRAKLSFVPVKSEYHAYWGAVRDSAKSTAKVTNIRYVPYLQTVPAEGLLFQ